MKTAFVLEMFCTFTNKMRRFSHLVFCFCLTRVLAQPFVLPQLPYGYSEYAPNIDALTMEIHITKHHQAYVNNLNKCVKGTPFETYTLEEILINLPPDGEVLRNNAGGHYNHSLFWEILAPRPKQGPISESLNTQIITQFGSMDSLRKALFLSATSRFGSGWAWLIVTPDKKLQVISMANQDNPLMACSSNRGIPILGIDVWEHAYYLNYQNRRADYLSAVWDLLNWKVVSENYAEALNSPLLSKLKSTNCQKKSKKH